MDSKSNGNFIPFKRFKALFLESTIEVLYTTKSNLIVLKYTVSLILSSYMCTVRLINNDKTASYRFFVVPGDGPALLEMSDI